MKRLVNTYYNYPNMELWDDKVWEDRYSETIPLAHKIFDINNENFRVNAKPEGEYRAEGDFDVQQLCWIYPDVVEELKNRGLKFHTTRHCIYITPIAHLGKEGYVDDMDTVFVLVKVV